MVKCLALVALLGVHTLVAQTCTVSLSPSGLSLGSGGGNGAIAVTATQTGCVWTATTNAPWISLTVSTGVAPSPVSYTIGANPGTTIRSGIIDVNGVSFVVFQDGSITPACQAVLTPNAITVPSAGQTGSLTVTVPQNCGWSATSSVSWAQVFPAAAATSGPIEYSVFPNFRPVARVGSITVGGAPFAIGQAGDTGLPDERFVRLLYFSFFGRNPSQAEVNFQVTQGLNRGLTRGELAGLFFNSGEFNTGGRFVAGLYLGLLARDAEFGGWQFQRDALTRGVVNQNQLIANFLGSGEYLERFGTPSEADFVRLLYRHILLREASQAEVDFQVTQGLNRGLTRIQLASNFLNSQEFRTGQGPRLTAFLLYSTILLRSGTDIELTNARNNIQGGLPVRTLIEDLFNSAEFAGLLN